MINYALSFLLPIIVFAGFIPSTQTYTAPILPTQRINIPTYEANYAPSPQIYAETPVSEPESIYCSCVLTLRAEILDLPLLSAIDWPLNTIEPKVGDIIKLQYYNATTTRFTYHLQIIREIAEENYKVYQGNKPKCATSTEEIAKDDDRILGFYNQDRQRLIDALTPIQKETLWNESGWSHYDTKGSVLRGKDKEWGLIQVLKPSWKYLTDLRRRDNVKPILLDKLSFEDQIIMFKFAFDRGYQNWWMGYNKIYEMPKGLVN